MDPEQLLVLVHPHPGDDYGAMEPYAEQAVESFDGETAVVSRNMGAEPVYGGKSAYDHVFTDIAGQGVISGEDTFAVESYDAVFLGGGNVGYSTENQENPGCLKRFYNQIRRHDQEHRLVPELTYNRLMQREYDADGRAQLVEQDDAYTVADLIDPDKADTLEQATNGISPETLQDYTLGNFDWETVRLESVVADDGYAAATPALEGGRGITVADD